jgi:hypothetical protein
MWYLKNKPHIFGQAPKRKEELYRGNLDKREVIGGIRR